MIARPAVVDASLATLYDRISPAVEDALIDTVKRLARTVPVPRADSFYGLDDISGPSLRTVERLTAHGDFRKYVFVLDGGGGMERFARWLTATYGCRVLVLDVLPRLLATGKRLSARAGLAERITSVGGALEAIPLRDGIFTQIWCVAALHHVADRGSALRELFRVLRPGSTIALHEIVRRSPSVPVVGPPWHHGLQEEYLDLLAAAGFTTIVSEDVDNEPFEPSAVARSAEEAFLRLVITRAPAEARAWNASEDALARVRALERGPDYRAVHFFARRPSV